MTPSPLNLDDDEYDNRIQRTGCALENEALTMCYHANGKDWRACRKEMEAFRCCFEIYQQVKQQSSSAPNWFSPCLCQPWTQISCLLIVSWTLVTCNKNALQHCSLESWLENAFWYRIVSMKSQFIEKKLQPTRDSQFQLDQRGWRRRIEAPPSPLVASLSSPTVDTKDTICFFWRANCRCMIHDINDCTEVFA